ncbi:MAG: aldo/keto reductase [Defluviitaleaceae bacterium]|nr:aldo/keto reductase [Defluviitaleaceae bacterium]
MEYIQLNTGAKMPMLGLGVFGVGEDDTGKEAVLSAIAAGYRSIDTAAAYNNEQLVGQAARESGIKREELFITTKLANTAQRAGDLAAAFDKSLENLGMDYVDLYLMHWPVPEHFAKSWLTMEGFFKSGRARAIGVSNFQPRHIAEIKKVWSVVPAMNQIELHPHLTQKPLLEVCKAEGIVPQSWSPLGGGQQKHPDFKQSLFANPVLVKIGEKYQKSAAQVILRWNIDLGIVTIPKSVTPARLKANIDIFDFKLTPEEISAINALNKDHRTGPDPETFHNFF